MIGILISESADILYSFAKITFDLTRGIYHWYYDIEPEKEKIKLLEDRIILLENSLKYTVEKNKQKKS